MLTEIMPSGGGNFNDFRENQLTKVQLYNKQLRNTDSLPYQSHSWWSSCPTLRFGAAGQSCFWTCWQVRWRSTLVDSSLINGLTSDRTFFSLRST